MTRDHVKCGVYSCTVCKGRHFQSEQGFNDHVKTVHNIFSCPKCDQIFVARDDLVRHKNDAGHGKPAFGVKSAFWPTFMSEETDISSVQAPMQLHRQSSQARPSIGQHCEPPTQTHPPAETRRQAPAPTHQQSPKQLHQTRSQVLQPSPQVQPQPHVVRSQPYLPPSEYQVFPAPVAVLEGQTQLARIQEGIQAEIQHAAAQADQAQARMFQSPVNVGQLPMEVCQAPSEVYERRRQVYHTPIQGYRPFSQGYQPQLQAHQSQMQVPPQSASQSPEHHIQSLVRYFHLPQHHSRPPVQDLESTEEDSQPQMQPFENQMQFPQLPAQTSTTPLQGRTQATQVLSPPTHLSAQNTTTAVTNNTSSSLPMQPAPSTKGFPLIYDKTRYNWTNLDPPEQTLLHRYILGRCHPVQRLQHQGYHVPSIIDTRACLQLGKPHQIHNFARSSMRRKAIVIDCDMVETTRFTTELAFIVAIDFLTGEVLINSYVAPTAPVTNWLTPVSGITQEKMDAAISEGKAFNSNHDARNALKNFLDHDTVLIGHALHHDLRTLSLIHGRIVDTALVTAEAVFSHYSSKSMLPRIWGLKQLARELLDIEMQNRGEGHDSLEDTSVTREILIWCLRSPECLRAWAEKTRSENEKIREQRKKNFANAAN
ncbi:Exonuclease RNase T/DNA polymerase III [Penicillium fimorum]|uniref:Exonuclease RNase T/DNA polymerase III n=1 Tax=Penicillium fimorum TaxID=1882269 RepID=A0A9W9Y618_9EURO|nr:Exonuclease RNase T/DNA polymerase III [Penicillium fimorum]